MVGLFSVRGSKLFRILGAVLGMVMAGTLFFYFTTRSDAATYTWDGEGGDGLWSTCTNWTSNTCPGSGDIAAFGSAATSSATIDASFAGSVLGVQINSGYTGTITQQRSLTVGSTGFTIADGSFVQGTNIIDLNDGSFTQSGGYYSMGVGTTTVDRNATFSGGTRAASSSAVFVFDGTTVTDDGTLTCTGDFFTPIVLSRTYLSYTLWAADFTLASGCNATTTGAVSQSSTITVSGNLHVSGDLAGAYVLFVYGTTTIAGDIAGTASKSGLQVFAGGYLSATGTTIDLNSTTADGIEGDFFNAGTVDMPNLTTMNVEGDFNDTGTFNYGSLASVTFNGSGIDVGVLSCTGDFYLPINIEKNYIADNVRATLTLNSGCNATTTSSVSMNGLVSVSGNLYINGDVADNTMLIVNGTTTVAGDFTGSRGIQVNSGGYLSAPSAVTVDINSGSSWTPDGDFRNSGTISFPSVTSFMVEGDYVDTGTFNYGPLSAVEFNGGGLRDDGTLTCTGDFYLPITLSKAYYADMGYTSDFTLASGCNATTTGATTMNGILTASGNLAITGALDGSYALIINGTTTVAGNISGTYNGIQVNAGGYLAMTGTAIDLNTNHSQNPEGDFRNAGTVDASNLTSFTVEGDYVDTGSFNYGPLSAVEFNGASWIDDGVLTCTGDFYLPIVLAKNYYTSASYSADFTVSADCNATTTTAAQTVSGRVFVYGDLVQAGNLTLTGASTVSGTYAVSDGVDVSAVLTVSSGAVLDVRGESTLTNFVLSSGSLVTYSGSGTYSSLSGLTGIDDIVFLGTGTYNLTEDLSFTGDFTNTGATINQTAGVTTVSGTTNTITTTDGSTTFYELNKNVTASSTLVFAGSATTTATRLLLSGTSGNLLSVHTATSGTQYKLDVAGYYNVSYLQLRDINNVNTMALYCLTGCVDEGNNVNIYFSGAPAYAGLVAWDGGGADTNWSTCANWQFDTCPLATDGVYFGEFSSKSSVIDSTFGIEINSIRITTDYSGTLTAGTDLFIYGSNGFEQDGGTFVAPSGILTLRTGPLSLTGGTFTHNGGTIYAVGSSTLTNTTAATLSNLILTSDVQTGLVANWKLDESSASASVIDSSPSGFTGTPYGTGGANVYPQPMNTDLPGTIPGNNLYTKDFDGTDDYVSFGATTLPSGSEARSVSAWAKTDTTATAYRWIFAYGNSATGQAFHIGQYGTRLDGGAFGTGLTATNKWDTTSWHHVVLTYDSTTARLYFDGVEVANGTYSWNTVLNRTYIGRQVNNAEYWNGQVDDVRVYDRALSAAEVADLYELPPTTVVLAGQNFALDTIVLATSTTLDVSTSGCAGAACNLTVSGDFINHGTFTPRTSTVILNGTNQQLLGDINFYKLTKTVASADTLTIGAGNTITVSNKCTLTGVSGGLLSLRSSSSGSQWNFAPLGIRSLTYLDVQDSNNTSGTNIRTVMSTNSGNNLNWEFLVGPLITPRLPGGMRLQGGTRLW